MFRVPLYIAVILSIAFGGGIFVTRAALEATVGFGAIRLGAFEAFPQAQTVDADPYAKSHRSKAGKLLFGSAEGLAFIARVDDAGNRLDPDCTYVISGQTPPARFWTLFATDLEDQPLDPGPDLPSGQNAWSVLRGKDGSFQVSVSRKAQPGNWIALAPDRPFKLVLNLLDTPTAGSSGVVDLTMPSVTKAGCGDV
jgi:hypothetical protein